MGDSRPRSRGLPRERGPRPFGPGCPPGPPARAGTGEARPPCAPRAEDPIPPRRTAFRYGQAPSRGRPAPARSRGPAPGDRRSAPRSAGPPGGRTGNYTPDACWGGPQAHAGPPEWTPSPLEPEKASRGGVGRVLEHARGHPQRRGQLIPNEDQVGRLVSLPPVRHGSEVGSVGLEHDVGQLQLSDDVGQGAFLEGRGSPHPDLEPHRKYPPG